MFTLFWWTVAFIVASLLEPQTFPNSIYANIMFMAAEIICIYAGIIFAILCSGIEFFIILGLPGSKFLKNSNAFSLKNTALSNVFVKHEEKIQKIRFTIFVILISIIELKIIKCSIGLSYLYLIFWLCINLDIALALATKEERKTYFQRLTKEMPKKIMKYIGVIVAIIAIFVAITCCIFVNIGRNMDAVLNNVAPAFATPSIDSVNAILDNMTPELNDNSI